MNHVGKEMAKSALRDRRVRSSATATMESEDVTVKVMQAGLSGGLSLEDRRYLLRALDVDMYVTGSNSRRMERRFSHISRRPDFLQVFSISFGAYLMSKPIYI